MIPLPPQQIPVSDGGGFMVIAWRRFYEDVRSRFGGSQDIKFSAPDDTHITFSYKGSDGVVRSGSVTLS